AVIGGDLMNGPVTPADKISAAVAHMGDNDLIVPHERKRDGRAHASELGIGGCPPHNVAIRSANDVTQLLGDAVIRQRFEGAQRALLGQRQPCLNRLYRQTAGFFARRRASHAIRYDGKYQIVIQPEVYVIFVILAYLSYTGARATMQTSAAFRTVHTAPH